jgi:hypothetical protein
MRLILEFDEYKRNQIVFTHQILNQIEKEEAETDEEFASRLSDGAKQYVLRAINERQNRLYALALKEESRLNEENANSNNTEITIVDG